jgi:hypothetical protein
MTWAQLVKLARELPETAEGIWFRTPSMKVRGKSFLRLKEDGKSVVFLLESVDEQEFLTRTQPELYFITDHYRGSPAVLARLSALGVTEARRRLRISWETRAPKNLLKPAAAAAAPATPGSAKRGRRRPARRTPRR